MDIIEFGMESDVNDEHPKKQPFPRDVLEFGMESDVNDEHPRKQ
jgi:hypothetical protein